MNEVLRPDMARDFLASAAAAGDTLDAMAQVPPPAVTGDYEVHGKPSPEFIEAMAQAYPFVPEPVRDYLRSIKTRVAFAGITTDLLPSGYSAIREPTQDDARTHRNQSAGYFFVAEKIIAVMETSLVFLPPLPPDEDESPNVRERTETADEVRGKPFLAIASTPEHTLYHETGHALFHLTLSEEERVQYLGAYRRDIERLGGPEEARKKGYGYFVQDTEHAGADEAFAESFAMQMAEIAPGFLYGRAPPPLPGEERPHKKGVIVTPYKRDTEKWRRDWPGVTAWIKDYSETFAAKKRQRTLTNAIENGELALFLNYLRDPAIDVNGLNAEGNSLLALASMGGHVEMVKALLRRPEIDINSRNIHTGESALYHAVSNNQTEIAELLLDRPEIDVRHSVRRFAFDEPRDLLHNAMWCADAIIVRRVATHPSINVNAVVDRLTALERAVCGGKPDIVEAVLAGRPSIDSVTCALTRLDEMRSFTSVGTYLSLEQHLQFYKSGLASVSEGLRPSISQGPTFLSDLQR